MLPVPAEYAFAAANVSVKHSRRRKSGCLATPKQADNTSSLLSVKLSEYVPPGSGEASYPRNVPDLV